MVWRCTGAYGLLKSRHLREFTTDLLVTDQARFVRLTSSLRDNSALGSDSGPYIWSNRTDWGNFWAVVGHHPSLEYIHLRDFQPKPNDEYWEPIVSALDANPRLQHLKLHFIRCDRPEWVDSLWDQRIEPLLHYNKYRP